MVVRRERYINPFTDYGFKRLFGEEPNDEDQNEPDKFRYDVKLTDTETCQVFYDRAANRKLTFVYLEMPKFQKDVRELTTRFDKWMFVIRNLNKPDRIPNELREGIFERLFEVAEIARSGETRFSPEEVQAYEDSLKSYRDLKNSLDTAFED
jgi:hypothetical protein